MITCTQEELDKQVEDLVAKPEQLSFEWNIGPKVRTFGSGATRGPDTDKLDYEGFISPIVLERYAKYMHKHRIQIDGSMRASDNWQKGIPLESCMKSGWRHFMDWFKHHRGYPINESIEDALCALIFNAQSYLRTILHDSSTNKTAPTS